MARIRYLKPSFFKDEDIADLSHSNRLLYQGLWVIADKEGRLEDRPKRIKAEIFPYENIDVEKGLSTLATKKQSGRPFINRYKTDGERYIQILKWHDHQKPHNTEKDSVIPPAPPNGDGNGDGESKRAQSECEVKQRLSNGEITVRSSKPCKPKDLEEVKKYFLEIKCPTEAEAFFDYFESSGWLRSNRTAIKDWKAAARNWLRSPYRNTNKNKTIRGKQDLVNTAIQIGEEIGA